MTALLYTLFCILVVFVAMAAWVIWAFSRADGPMDDTDDQDGTP